jgi:hypothetical protein
VVLFFLGYDVFYLHEFRYVYKAGVLLLVPLLFHFLIYNLEEYAKFNIEYFLNHYIRSTIGALTYNSTPTEKSYRDYKIYLSEFAMRYTKYEATIVMLEAPMEEQLLNPNKKLYQTRFFEKYDQNLENSVENLVYHSSI